MTRNRFATFAWGVLVAVLAVILWGAYVRASGSGAGCGSHWPLCNGEVVPRSPSAETLIEYTHRLTSGVVGIAAFVLLVWAFRRFERGHPARLGAVLSTVFMVGEAAIGAGLVLFEMVADNESIARAWWMGAHLINTFLLIGALALTAYWGEGGAPVRLRGQGRLLRLTLAAFLFTLLIGTSGAIAALGDTLFPATSLAEELKKDVSPAAHLFIQLRVLHPLFAVLGSLLLLHLVNAVRTRRPAPPLAARRHATQLSLLVYGQLVLGTLNILLLAPIFMQIVHLLVADLVWIALTLTAAASLAAPPAAGETAAAG